MEFELKRYSPALALTQKTRARAYMAEDTRGKYIELAEVDRVLFAYMDKLAAERDKIAAAHDKARSEVRSLQESSGMQVTRTRRAFAALRDVIAELGTQNEDCESVKAARALLERFSETTLALDP